jgi:membrane protease subunit (stomatin/prohibitin family)
MGFKEFFKAGAREMFIARPDEKKHLIVYKWPDSNIPLLTQLTIDSDECAVFFKNGQCHGVLPGGQRHTLSTQNLPFLNNFINEFTGGNMFIAEIFFVKIQPVRGIPVGGPIGDMIDPLTQEAVTPRMFGEFAVQVTDPARFIIGYVGQAAAVEDNEQILDWVRKLFLRGVKQVIGEICEVQEISLLQLTSRTELMADGFQKRCPSLEEMGMRVAEMGNFNINFSKEDKQRLQEAQGEMAKARRQIQIKKAEAQARQYELDQKLDQDKRYVQEVAGSFQNLRSGDAMLAAAHNEGGGMAAMGAQVAAGVGMGNYMAHNMAHPQGPQYPAPGMQGPYGQNPAQQAPPQAMAPTPGVAPGGQASCGGCGAVNATGAKFCANCGKQMAPPAPQALFCTSCGSKNPGNSKFCANCGNGLSAPTG